MAPKLLRKVWKNRVLLQVYLPPLMFLFIPIMYNNAAAKCAYLLVVMVSYWLTECIPTAVTGVLPLVFLPLFGIVRAADLAPCYMKDIMLTFISSIAIACMLEKSGLHKRIALKTLIIFGQKPAMLLFGVMFITWFCSMWTSNTAATVLMMTILDALIKQFEKHADIDADGNPERLELIVRDRSSNDSAMHSAIGTAMSSQMTLVTNADDVHRVNGGNRTYSSCKVGLSVGASNSLTASTLNFSDEKRMLDDESRVIKIDVPDIGASSPSVHRKKPKSIKDIKKMLGLSVCYSASCGGIATLTGTPTNLILLGQLQTSFNHTGNLNFASWLVTTLPLSFILIIAAWIWLQVCFLGARTVLHGLGQSVKNLGRSIKRNSQYAIGINDASTIEANAHDDGKAALVHDYIALGSLTMKEIIAATYLLLLVVLWLSREPGIPGWGKLFRAGYLTDTLPAFFIVILANCTPISLYKPASVIDEEPKTSKKVEFMLNWKDIEKSTPWGFLFLVGGGFAMSEGCRVSGLTALVGKELCFLGDLPIPALILITILFTTTLTGVSSNLAVCSILLPLLADLSVHMRVNPLLLMLPATLASSFAFILPVSTPPNAVVYSKGYVKASDMLKCGSVMSLLAVLITTICMFTYIDWYLKITELPSWTKSYMTPRVNESSTSTIFPNGTVALTNLTTVS